MVRFRRVCYNATGKNFKLEPDGTGIKILRRGGLSIHLR